MKTDFELKRKQFNVINEAIKYFPKQYTVFFLKELPRYVNTPHIERDLRNLFNFRNVNYFNATVLLDEIERLTERLKNE